MAKSSEIGKTHQKGVFEALQQQLKGQSIEHCDVSTRETVAYIVKQYPEIKTVLSKNNDQEPDLIIQTATETIPVNLFYIEGNGKIQPKNLGAKSFLTKYFHAPTWQNLFNIFLEEAQHLFFKAVVETKEEVGVYDQTLEIKRKMKELYPKFTADINPIRRSFLFNIREYAFKLLNEQHQSQHLDIQAAYRELMLIDSVNIITRYKSNREFLKVENWEAPLDPYGDVEIYRKGNDSIGIRIGVHALTIRFKFESGPDTALKLATSYDDFPSDESVVKLNKKTVGKFEKTITNHMKTKTGNSSNAIGKCNEAVIYYQFVKQNPTIHQIDDKEFLHMLEEYSPTVPIETLQKIHQASEITVEKMETYLQEKYSHYVIEAIQLVPDSYIKNHLDTSDLHIVVKVNGKAIDEYFSLKAAAQPGSRITMKNPGIGTILGTGYFGIGTMMEVVTNVKQQFEQGQVTHQQSLEVVSEELGNQLAHATQQHLRKGIMALFGKAPTVVTFYKKQQCVIKKHTQIVSDIQVYPKTPTLINTKLIWNEGEEYIILRVKFSGGQSKGWSSLKLACEYTVESGKKSGN